MRSGATVEKHQCFFLDQTRIELKVIKKTFQYIWLLNGIAFLPLPKCLSSYMYYDPFLDVLVIGNFDNDDIDVVRIEVCRQIVLWLSCITMTYKQNLSSL